MWVIKQKKTVDFFKSFGILVLLEVGYPTQKDRFWSASAGRGLQEQGIQNLYGLVQQIAVKSLFGLSKLNEGNKFIRRKEAYDIMVRVPVCIKYE